MDKTNHIDSVLIEASVVDEARRIVEVTIIKPGPSLVMVNNKPVVYPAQALEQSLPLWQGAACFCDHWNKSVRNIAGVFFAPWYDSGVKAHLRFIDDSLYYLVAQIIRDRSAGETAPDIGLSADILCSASEGDEAIEVSAITGVISADIVFRPAAGGSFDRILNAVAQAHPEATGLSRYVVQSGPAAAGSRLSTESELRLQLSAQASTIAGQSEAIARLESQLFEAVIRHREGVLGAHPEIPEHLIGGATIAELDESLEKALALVNQVRRLLEKTKIPPQAGQDQDNAEPLIPPGSPPRSGIDVSALTPRQKIEWGLTGGAAQQRGQPS